MTSLLSSGLNLLKLFVYGTLKSGERNHYWLTDLENGHANFLGTGITCIKYPLVIAAKFNYPFLLDIPNKGYNVMGEVYEVDEKMLSNLDKLEDHPYFFFRREEPIMLKEQDLRLNCWTYFLKVHKPHLLDLIMLESYSSTGSHQGPPV